MKTNYLKLAALGLMLAAGTAVQAQTTTANAGTANTTQAKKAGEVIKLIDNKGTIKYLQSNNGITTITSTAAGNKTTTTWQLGGTLVENTNIELGANNFVLDATGAGTVNIKGVDVIDAAATPATDATTGTANTFTLLVRDEATGEIQKMLATDLVSGIRKEYSQTADATANVDITVTGLPALTAGSTMAKLFVFRNGAKLRPTADFTVAANTVTIKYDATELPMYAGDIIDIQYIK